MYRYVKAQRPAHAALMRERAAEDAAEAAEAAAAAAAAQEKLKEAVKAIEAGRCTLTPPDP